MSRRIRTAPVVLFLALSASAGSAAQDVPTLSRNDSSAPVAANDIDSETLRAQRMAQFERQLARWQAVGTPDYEFTVANENCHCLYGPYYGPLRVSVRSGAAKRAVYLGETRDGYARGARITERTSLRTTVDALFARVRKHIEDADAQTSLEIAYDATWGFPTLIDFDHAGWNDAQSRIVVSGFAPMPPDRSLTPHPRARQ
jgi:hypothetical protein